MKILLALLCLCLISISAFALDNPKAGDNNDPNVGRNDGGKKDATMETKSTADHSGQNNYKNEPNMFGKKKSAKQGPRSMQNTYPGTDSSPTPKKQ